MEDKIIVLAEYLNVEVRDIEVIDNVQFVCKDIEYDVLTKMEARQAGLFGVEEDYIVCTEPV